MQTKLSRLLALLASGDEEGAMRIAARFPDLGLQKEAITRGWDARQNPRLYRQLGRDPEALWRAGVEALRARYGAR